MISRLTIMLCLAYGVAHASSFQTATYKKVGDRELKVDVFHPAEPATSASPRPAIAFFHGGGWVFGNRSIYHAACRRYAAMGFVCLTFEYRLSRNPDGTYPHPAITPIESVKDARSAIRWTRAHADRFGIAPERIAAWGRSAGGQLVWATALCDGLDEQSDNLAISPTPNALLTFSACYNTVQTWVERMLGSNRNRIWEISPYHRLKPNHPPAIGFHGRQDTTEPWRVANWFREKTQDLGSPFELVTMENEGHHLAGGGDPPGEVQNAEILDRADIFLRATVMHRGTKGAPDL